MFPLNVYLDSSDFSRLSDPKEVKELFPILEKLQDWISDGKIICSYSAIHLSEMAPIKVDYAYSANRRSDLLASLCGRNAMIAVDALFEDELKYAQELSSQKPIAYSSAGDWFPGRIASIDITDGLTVKDQVATEVTNTIQNSGLNRAARRQKQRELLRNGKLRAGYKASMVSRIRDGVGINEILDQYPMRLEDAQILGRYVVGDVSKHDAQEAFLASLRDPKWMMRWFEKNHDKLCPLIEWTRSPALSIQAQLEKTMEELSTFRQNASKQELAAFQRQAEYFQNEFLVGVCRRMSNALIGQTSDSLILERIAANCPGLTCGLKTMYSVAQTMMGKSPRPPSPSDFQDGLHAVYAPYVDIFRADAFIAPHVEKYTKGSGIRVVSKLQNLPNVIQEELAKR